MAEKKLYTYILVDNGVDPEQLILWDTLEVTIGRNPDRDVVLTSTEVSREHAAFKREGNTYCILDNHTGNGTFVNETQVIRHELKNGDVVRIGDAVFTFKQSLDNPMVGRRGAKYASQLKNFGVPGMGGDEGGRTIMALGDPLATPGFTPDGIDLRPTDEMEFQLDDLNAAFQTTYPPRDVDLDDLFSSASPPAQSRAPKPQTRAAEEFANLELTDEDSIPAPPAPTTQLDSAPHALTQKNVTSSQTSQRSATNAVPSQHSGAAAQPTKDMPRNINAVATENAKTITLGVQATPPPSTASPSATQSTVSLTLQIKGLTPELKRALSLLLDKPIVLPPLKICLSAKKNTP